MQYITEKQRETPVIATPGVLVAGAGPAGICVAIAAARTGAKTMIVERYGIVGEHHDSVRDIPEKSAGNHHRHRRHTGRNYN